jgi:hypothetical protein
MISKKNKSLNIYISKINNTTTEKNLLKKKIEYNSAKFGIESKKLKVIGNFFKLKFLKKKKLIKFNLCLAHKIYILKNKLTTHTIIKKLKKNKIIFIKKKINNITKNKSLINCLKSIKLKRPLNTYTKKGIKLSKESYKAKVGKKTTYT